MSSCARFLVAFSLGGSFSLRGPFSFCSMLNECHVPFGCDRSFFLVVHLLEYEDAFPSTGGVCVVGCLHH
jgi:hypothetical protein